MADGSALGISVKRAYEAASDQDGFRILVDRLWPRGLARQTAAIDLWLKDIAPSNDLRTWFAHDPARWPEFRRRYRDELDHNPEAVAELRRRLGRGRATLVYAAKDEARNNAVALKEYLEGDGS